MVCEFPYSIEAGCRLLYSVYILMYFMACSDSHQRLSHMQQMPQELHQLQQRACPKSSSHHDETSHAWRRCPGRSQLGGSTRQRPNTPPHQFCRSTVQYIIDCNRSTSEDVTTHSLPDIDESANSPSTADISRRPSRKRPWLDMVDF